MRMETVMNRQLPLRFRRLTATALALVISLPLGACSTNIAANRSVESIHQPVVERNAYVFEVSTLPGGGLAVAEQRRLLSWFDALDLRYGDRISIDDPADSNATRGAVEAVAARFAIALADTAPVLDGEVSRGTARVIVNRSIASVPGCPDWTQKKHTNFDNATSSNFGCAINGNLAAMVADKDDLVRGTRGTGSTVVMSSTKAIETFRAKPSTGADVLKEVSSRTIN
jgi:pilus assembly protein CpaD